MGTVDLSKIEDIFKMWQSIMSSGWVGMIIGGALLFMLFIIWWFARKNKNDIAHGKTEEGRIDDQANLPINTNPIEHSADEGADHVDDVRQQYSDPSKPKPKRPT